VRRAPDRARDFALANFKTTGHLRRPPFQEGLGISNAVAEKFGGQGFRVAINGRNRERLEAGVKALAAKGIEAKAFAGDMGDPAAVERVVKDASAALGPITVLQWTAYGTGAGDLLTSPASELRGQLAIAIDGLLAAVKAALPDLEQQRGAAGVLVTNGGLGYSDPQVDKAGVHFGAMGLSVANAAKHKLVGLLNARLGERGIYVGEVTVLNAVKGTAWDSGNATIEASAVGDAFWRLYQARKDVYTEVK
jgi:NAD(P)-dependent dehydrogenase (short-subunit alcohol dehydrogenase family)